MNSITEEKRALMRTAANTMICLFDLFPGFGLAFPAIANAAKFAKKLDLTPDVPKRYAFGSLVFEFPTFGLFPSYMFQTGWQFYKDWPKIARLFRARRIRRHRISFHTK